MFPNFLTIRSCLLPHKGKPVPLAHLWGCRTCCGGGWPKGQDHSFKTPTSRNSICWNQANFPSKKPQAPNNELQRSTGNREQDHGRVWDEAERQPNGFQRGQSAGDTEVLTHQKFKTLLNIPGTELKPQKDHAWGARLLNTCLKNV